MKQRENVQWYLFFSEAIKRQLFLYSVAGVNHQAVVCWAEGSHAGGQAVTLQHMEGTKNIRWRRVKKTPVSLKWKMFIN